MGWVKKEVIATLKSIANAGDVPSDMMRILLFGIISACYIEDQEQLMLRDFIFFSIGLERTFGDG